MAAPLMSVDEFQDFIDRFGENSDDWPADRRPLAEALLVQSKAARECLAQARTLRQQFQDSAVTAPTGLADRIFAAALAKDKGK